MCNRPFELIRRSVGVFKTDIRDRAEAESVLDAVGQQLPGCDASLDLEDCDKVLRVERATGNVNESEIIDMLRDNGHQIERLD